MKDFKISSIEEALEAVKNNLSALEFLPEEFKTPELAATGR